MMKGLKELLMKKAKAGNMLKPDQIEAKKSVLDDLEGVADKGMAHDLQKVTVASPSKEGLKEGLEMAEDKVEEMGEMEEEMSEEGMMEEEDMDLDSMSLDQIEDAIQELEAKKRAMVE